MLELRPLKRLFLGVQIQVDNCGSWRQRGIRIRVRGQRGSRMDKVLHSPSLVLNTVLTQWSHSNPMANVGLGGRTWEGNPWIGVWWAPWAPEVFV